MKVLVGVGGGIAAYKSAEIVRALIKRGDEVRVVMTQSAQEFISPMTLQVLSENAVGTELFDPTFEHQIGHIDAARWPDVILVAPATANLLARAANGMANDLLTTILTATTAKVVFAPAMNTQMFFNARVQANIKTLQDDGHYIADPDSGELACKEIGPGRLPDPDALLQAIDIALRPTKLLAGKHILVTAGPTREHLDPARFLSNPSSGKMGYAIAAAAAKLGANVTLVSGPTALNTPSNCTRVDITTAAELANEVFDRATKNDIIVMAAAVADWRPKNRESEKQPKVEGDLSVTFERTTDILKTLGEKKKSGDLNSILIGFAAESHDVVERAKAKRLRKGADFIVANQIGGSENAFGSDSNHAWVIGDDFADEIERAPKPEVATSLWNILLEHI